MKAAFLKENKEIAIEKMTLPIVMDGHALIKVKYSGVCGSDIPRIFNNGARYYPIVLGHEFSGVIENINTNEKNLKIGDRVAVAPLIPCMNCKDCKKGNYSQCKDYTFIGSRIQGAWAEYISVPINNIVKLPEEVSLKQGAFFEPLTVALHALSLYESPANKKVAILGMGTIGLLTLQCVKAMGAKEVTAIDICDKKLELSKKVGADKIFNLSANGVEIEKYDLIIESSGANSSFKYALEIAENKGEILYIGTPHNNLEFTPNQFELINRKELTLKGAWMNYSGIFPGKEWETANELFSKKRIIIDDLIDVETSIENFPKVIEKLGNKEIQGKILIKF